jgi:hypothetical protein
MRLLGAGLMILVAAVPVAGCKEVESESAAGYEPAKLSAVGGNEDAKLVTFTAEGARRVGVQTGEIERSGTRLVAPYAALIYDEEGAPYVYTVIPPRSYLRAAVEVERIDGGRVLLADGPRAGTKVVTEGATEVYGAEEEIAGSH